MLNHGNRRWLLPLILVLMAGCGSPPAGIPGRIGASRAERTKGTARADKRVSLQRLRSLRAGLILGDHVVPTLWSFWGEGDDRAADVYVVPALRVSSLDSSPNGP